MNITEIFERLQGSRTSTDELDPPRKPGVYAIFAKPNLTLPLVAIPTTRLIYIGRSSNLQSREFDAHFSSDNTGFSTVRRSLGALLKEELLLVAIPRGKGLSDKDFQNYRFIMDGEIRLTDWMTKNLEIGIYSPTENYELIEEQLIKSFHPILCLKGCDNPFATPIKALRKKCSIEARENTSLHRN